MNEISVLIREIHGVPSPLPTGHSDKVLALNQERALNGMQPCWGLDQKLPACRTVKQIPVVYKVPHLRYFIKEAQTN